MSIVEILKKARTLLASGWCRNWLAKNKSGVPVDAQNEEAIRFCARGAILKVFGINSTLNMTEDQYNAEEAVVENTKYLNIVEFNNSCKDKRQVLRAFDSAISFLSK